MEKAEDGSRILSRLGLRVPEDVVHSVVSALRTKTSLYKLYEHGERRDGTLRAPVCGKGTAYKIKKLYQSGKLDEYLALQGPPIEEGVEKEKDLVRPQQISKEGFRQWVDAHFNELVEVVEQLKRLPTVAPALRPEDVLYSPGAHVGFGHEVGTPHSVLRILQKQLEAYAAENPVWVERLEYIGHLEDLRQMVNSLFIEVQKKVTKRLKKRGKEGKERDCPDLRDPKLQASFSNNLFWHAVAKATGWRGMDNFPWAEEKAEPDLIVVRRGAYTFSPVPPKAVRLMKEAFEELMKDVSVLPTTENLRQQLALFEQRRRNIEDGLDNLLVE